MKIRLALRQEGHFWNAYLALPNTMEGAKLIGSIALGPVKRKPELKAAFMSLMQAIMADAIEDVTGTAPDHFEIETAAEAERSGNA